MIRTVTPSAAAAFLEAINDLHSSSSRSIPISKFNPYRTTICCSSRNSHAYIPKLEPFSRTKLDRVLKDPPLIQKSKNELADYCSTLEGDDSYSCWQAYFELKDLEVRSMTTTKGSRGQTFRVVRGCPAHDERARVVGRSVLKKPSDMCI